MNRLSLKRKSGPSPISSFPTGYTLVEILVATTLALVVMGAVVQMFGTVGQSVTASRAMLESAEQLRLAQMRLQQDLAGVTVTMNPPRKPDDNEGYFEYIEGPVGVDPAALPRAVNSDLPGSPDDTTVGDFDDILMFTTRSTGQPFVGKFDTDTIQSEVAEVAWFVRGRTLYRRVLLVSPSSALPPAASYAGYDVSMRLVAGVPRANTLGDLTMRENRFAHPTNTFPFDVRRWGQLRLPTLRECSDAAWTLNKLPVSPPDPPTTDFWTNDTTQRLADNDQGNGPRVADDVILTNVIGFDVKAWESQSDSYVNAGHENIAYNPAWDDPANLTDKWKSRTLRHTGHPKAGINGTYDTWSTHYEAAGAAGLAGPLGRALDGFDTDTKPTIDENGDGNPANDGNGIVDDQSENLTAPPYPVPLRGIQVKIRVFEPDSRQIREVTVVQEFLPQ